MTGEPIGVDGYPTWFDNALCGEQPAEFLDALERRPHWFHDRKLIALCHRCPVLAECGAYADENDERFGIWGGRRRG